MGGELVFSRGRPAGSLDGAAKVMAADVFTLSVVMGDGEQSADVLHADLSAEYVALNAFGGT